MGLADNFKKAANTASGFATGGVQGATFGAVTDAAREGGLGSWAEDKWGDVSGQKAGQEADKGMAAAMSTVDPEYQALSGLAGQMEGVGQNYVNQMNAAGEDARTRAHAETGRFLGEREQQAQQYQDSQKILADRAGAMANDAQETYSNTIQPEFKQMLSKASSEAQDPALLTAAQAQDPNNPVAQSFRDFYDKRAQNVGRRGLADVGTLQALGAQAYGTLAGSMGPMTGSQMQMLQAGTAQQAGQAFANTQRQMDALQQQGIDQGWLQTQMGYERGQQAQDRWAQSAGNLQNAETANQGLQQSLRGEQSGYAGNVHDAGRAASQDILAANQYETGLRHGTMTGEAANQYGVAAGDLARRGAIESNKYGTQREISMGKAGMSADEQLAKQGMLANILGGAAQGGAAALSDRRLKHSIGLMTRGDIIEFFKAVNPVTYQYIDGKGPKGTKAGLILQDVENTQLGKILVKKDENGYLCYDPNDLLGILLGAIKCLAL